MQSETPSPFIGSTASVAVASPIGVTLAPSCDLIRPSPRERDVTVTREGLYFHVFAVAVLGIVRLANLGSH
jgi:hypothetical protein